MTDFPWSVSIGLGIVLLGTLSFIVYIMLLDKLEKN
jgi:preprotein translocase subunit Sss1